MWALGRLHDQTAIDRFGGNESAYECIMHSDGERETWKWKAVSRESVCLARYVQIENRDARCYESMLYI